MRVPAGVGAGVGVEAVPARHSFMNILLVLPSDLYVALCARQSILHSLPLLPLAASATPAATAMPRPAIINTRNINETCFFIIVTLALPGFVLSWVCVPDLGPHTYIVVLRGPRLNNSGNVFER